MVLKCRDYLVDKLNAIGMQAKPITSRKALEAALSPRICAVLFGTDDLARNGSKKFYEDETGARRKRTKVFDRKTTFTVHIGDSQPEKVDEFVTTFLLALDKGVYIDGNYVAIDVDAADWEDGDDTWLRGKVVTSLSVIFDGGVYRDTGLARISNVDILEIEKEI